MGKIYTDEIREKLAKLKQEAQLKNFYLYRGNFDDCVKEYKLG